MPNKQTNAYGELNPLYPIYDDKEEELNELMGFFKFSYEPSSGYAGTGVFEIIDADTNKTYIMTIKADPNEGVDVFRSIPNNEDISFHCTLPYKTFHNAFWGYTTAKTLVMGGGCKIQNWAYRAAYNFGISFDMTANKWVQYYASGQSIKKMTNNSNDKNNNQNTTQRMNIIGANLPKCANETDFMYEWQPKLNEICETNKKINYRTDIFDMIYIWRNKQRNIIKMNNNKHIWLWDKYKCSIDNKYVKQMEYYRNNLTFNPLIIGKSFIGKWKNKIKIGGLKCMDEYYGFYSQYTTNKIGSVSLGLFNNSVKKFNAFVYKQTAENEVAHFSLLNSMF